MPPPPFAVTRDGELIQTVPLARTVRTGIDYEDVRLELGLIAEFEEREAAAFTSVPWHTWVGLELPERAASVAHYRIHHLIEAHANDAVSRESERKARQASSG